MALTPERIDRLIQQADRLAPKEGSIFRALAKLTEAEVRKQDTELIRQMLDALENSNATLWEEDDDPSRPAHAAITAGRARLDGKP